MGREEAENNLGRVSWIGAESVGLPGQRTFRLMMMSDRASAQLWLEKEQLQALAEAIARMLLEIDTEAGQDFRPPVPSEQAGGEINPKPAEFPAHPDIDFQVVALGLRYDPARDVIALDAFEQEAAEDAPATVRCLITRRQIERLQSNSLDVVSAGRPRCPLCHMPLPEAGIPHFCPPTNGHQKLEDE
jgi:uncharacterized repeat protein (TIGR03847 family)